MMPWKKLEPSWLPRESQVGDWKVKAFHGGGAYGAVFRAVLATDEQGEMVALKVAYSPWDPRFQREAELLTRIQHSSVPRLLGHGEWQHAGGLVYPYLAMQWVEGAGLYEWAGRHNPGGPQLRKVLAQVARALEATHAAGGLHRDVKGDTIRVSPTGQAFLTDYGSGTYAGAAPLTRDGFAPGTPHYRSREAWDFALHRPRNAPAVYPAQPSDDVYALGVCAFRCVTGEYPPPVDVREEETGPGQLVWTAARPARELNPQVDPELSELIRRMLSAQPEDRPMASEVAQVLEEGIDQSAAAEPFMDEEQEPEDASDSVRRALARSRLHIWVVVCTGLGSLVGAAAAGWGLHSVWEGLARDSAREERRVLGPAGVGNIVLKDPTVEVEQPSGQKKVGLPLPKDPLPGQRRAPRCQPPVETSINGGCWVPVRDAKPPCGDVSYEWNGGCYVPNFSPPRKPTSDQP